MYWVKVDEARRVSWACTINPARGLRAERMEFRKLWLPRQGCHTFRLTPEARLRGRQRGSGTNQARRK